MATQRRGRGGATLADAVKELYSQGQTDYWLEPIVVTDRRGRPRYRIRDGDGVVFCCRRGEREIQLTDAFVDPQFNHFQRPFLPNLTFVILTLYHEKYSRLPVAFAPVMLPGTLGETVSQAGLRQARIAESEKYAHVTFFLNGGKSQPFPGEDDVCVPSPRGLPFDQVPELSLPAVSAEVLQAIGRGYDLIVANFANGDVIGHTQNNEAKITCAEAVDEHLGRVLQAGLAAGYVVLVTADHGNLEEMITPEGTPHIAHTANPVAFIVCDPRAPTPVRARDGKLADIAPTVLSALGVEQPAAMDGKSLLPGYNWGGRRRVLLLILDGWGIGKEDETNPIFLGRTPVWDDLMRAGSGRLQAAGEAVGLQEGKPGNSEAGHMNIGAGRVVLQDDVRLDNAVRDGLFQQNETLLATIRAVKQRKASLHLIGLLSDKSSHGSMDYPLAVLQMAKEQGLHRVYLHVIFDGRSTAPGSAPALLAELERRMDEIGAGTIASGIGRGYALDRDGNYARTKLAYEALVLGMGKKAVQ